MKKLMTAFAAGAVALASQGCEWTGFEACSYKRFEYAHPS